MYQAKSSIAKLVTLGILELVSAICLLCTSWLGIQFGGEKVGFTLWKVGSFTSELSYYAEDGEKAILVLVAIVLYLGMAASVLTLAYTAYSMYKNYVSGAQISPLGFYVPGGFSVLVMLVVLIINISINSDIGFSMDLLYLTFTPFLVLIVSLGGYLVLRLVSDASFDSVTGKLRQAGASAVEAGRQGVSNVRIGSRVCPTCGAACKDSLAVFCSECGSKIDIKLLCAQCGAELKPGMRFCSRCGAPAQPVQVDLKPHCSECGAELKPDMRFCTRCGAPVQSPLPTQQPQQTEQTPQPQQVEQAQTLQYDIYEPDPSADYDERLDY